MAHHSDEIIIPRGAILAAAGLIGLALSLALLARLTDVGATRMSTYAPSDTMRLIFTEHADHSFTVHDAAQGREIRSFGPSDGGFIRVVMTSMAQKRAAAGIRLAAPYELSRDAAGRAVLADPETGGVLTLAAFGPGNAAAFAALHDNGR